jgi:two-component system chemotaxis response regulator CheB
VRSFPNAAFDLVPLAASAGGVPALRALVSRLPPDFPAPLALVLHLSPAYPSRLPELLRSWGRLDAAFAAEGDRPRAGTVHVAPPDRHLIVRPDGRLGLLDTAKVHHTRPAADPLFTTAAARFGPRTLAVVLTGLGRDGTAGALAVRAAGGVVLAQEPSTAYAAGMPAAVIASGAADLVLSPEGLGSALVALVMVPGAVGLLGPPRFARATGPV